MVLVREIGMRVSISIMFLVFAHRVVEGEPATVLGDCTAIRASTVLIFCLQLQVSWIGRRQELSSKGERFCHRRKKKPCVSFAIQNLMTRLTEAIGSRTTIATPHPPAAAMQ